VRLPDFILAMWNPAADARGITLHVRLDPGASGGSCDSVRIQHIVWNLVSNAVKFTRRPEGRRGRGARGRVSGPLPKPVDPHELTSVIAGLAGRTG
jgi:signal transduction histidine kinase